MRRTPHVSLLVELAISTEEDSLAIPETEHKFIPSIKHRISGQNPIPSHQLTMSAILRRLQGGNLEVFKVYTYLPRVHFRQERPSLSLY
jgi:hypothetical protein